MLTPKTSESDPLRIAAVTLGNGHGRIGITLCPGKTDPDEISGARARDLDTDLDAIRRWGATAVVSLITDEEIDHLSVRDLPKGVRDRLRLGFDVLIHCRGGLGRAGTIAARLLVELGARPNDAIRLERNDRALEIMQLSPQQRKEAIELAYKDVPDLNPAEVRAFLKKDTIYGYVGNAQLSQRQLDAYEWRFLKAWEDDDVQGILDMIGSPRQNELMERSFRLPKWGSPDNYELDVAHYKFGGAAQGLSDLLDATTSHRIADGYTHTLGYYTSKANKYRRGSETFANIIDVLGSGPFGETLLRKVIPELLEETLDQLAKIAP